MKRLLSRASLARGWGREGHGGTSPGSGRRWGRWGGERGRGRYSELQSWELGGRVGKPPPLPAQHGEPSQSVSEPRKRAGSKAVSGVEGREIEREIDR